MSDYDPVLDALVHDMYVAGFSPELAARALVALTDPQEDAAPTSLSPQIATLLADANELLGRIQAAWDEGRSAATATVPPGGRTVREWLDAFAALGEAA